MLDQVAAQPNSAGELVRADRPGPAVAQVASQVEQASQAAGRAGKLGRPASQMGQIAAAGGQPRVPVPRAGQQHIPALLRAAPQLVAPAPWPRGSSAAPSSPAGPARLAARAWSSRAYRSAVAWGTGRAPGWRWPTRLAGRLYRNRASRPRPPKPGRLASPRRAPGWTG